MPRTAVVNPRRRRRSGKRRRRRNPNVYGSAALGRRRRRRRRRNPATTPAASIRKAYSTRGYRQKNPGLDFDQAIDILPAATAGDMAARWATHIAGEMEDDQPGIAHAIAIYIAAVFGSDLIGSILGSASKAQYAQIGALAFGGSLFTRKIFLKDSEWAQRNLFLGEDFDLDLDDDDDDDDDDLDGFTDTSALGALTPGQTYIDEQGRKWQQTSDGGWIMLSGPYEVQNDPAAAYSGFTDTSELGRRRAASSFGY